MNRRADGWDLAYTVLVAVFIGICIVALLRDVQRPSRDIISWRHNSKRAYMERWQEELLYGTCMIIGGIMLVHSINRLRKR
jgi:hypothetical protein